MAIGFLFLGIRGRIDEKSPIRIGAAYFSHYDFANQAGLNPVFTFIRSWFDSRKSANKHLQLMDDNIAIRLTQQYLGITKPNPFFPIARTIKSKLRPKKYSIVLVMMESMSSDYMKRFGNTQSLTPSLDSIANSGYCFDHFYS